MLSTKVKISPFFFAVLTAFFIIDKNGIACWVLLFSLLHEAGHFMALLCIKTAPKAVDLSAFGIHILLKENMSTALKCIVLMAGFTVNFILAALFFTFEKTLFAYINLITGILTAVPLSSTDGGAVLRILLDELPSGKGEGIFRIITFLLLTLFSAGFVFIAFFTGNYFLFIAFFYMLLCVIKKAA